MNVEDIIEADGSSEEDSSLSDDLPQQITEGEEYVVDDLPDSDMSPNGNLEWVGDMTMGARYGDYYVTFEWEKVRCTDVTHVSDLSSEQ